MATIYLVKGSLDAAATSLADAQTLFSALANPATAANAAAIDRITGKFESLVQSDTAEPLVISSIDDAAGTISSWVTDSGTSVSVGLGDADSSGAYTYAATYDLSISGNTRTGTLALNTTALQNALSGVGTLPDRLRRTGSLVRFVLQIRTSSAGNTETKALLPFSVAPGVLSATATDLNPQTYYTREDGLAAFAALTDSSIDTNSTGDTTLNLSENQKVLAAQITFSGSAGTRRVVLSDANAVGGCVIALRLILPATASITVEIYSSSTSGTLLASVTTDGTAGTVGLICTRGATAWSEPTSAAWLD